MRRRKAEIGQVELSLTSQPPGLRQFATLFDSARPDPSPTHPRRKSLDTQALDLDASCLCSSTPPSPAPPRRANDGRPSRRRHHAVLVQAE